MSPVSVKIFSLTVAVETVRPACARVAGGTDCLFVYNFNALPMVLS